MRKKKGGPPAHADWLGTERVRSDMTGAACEIISSLPFGDGESTTGSCGDPSTRHFTGKERDAESGLDYFGARYYSNGMGRFITPDWSATPIPVPYAHLDDPQTLNQYVYVRDRPLTLSDRDGHGFWRKLWNCFSYGSCHETNEIIDNERTYLRDRGVAIRDPKTGKIIKYSDATNAQIDDAFRSLRNMEIFNQIRDALGIPPTVPPMLGANGTQVTSKTLWQEDKARIDVENPNPGQRPGQIHYQDETGKYIYDVGTGRFQGLSQTQNDNLLSKPEVQTAIQKGLRYLGVGQ